MRAVRFDGLWRNPEFLKLWAGQTISVFGSMISGFAISIMAIQMLGAQEIEMGILSALGGIPVVLVGLFAGVWADRLRRRPIMIFADVGRAMLLGSLPVAAFLNVLTLEHLYVVVALTATLTVFFDVSDQSLLPAIVRREHIMEANSKLGVSSSVAEVGGNGFGGMLVQFFGAPLAILLDAISFVFSAVFIAWVRTVEEVPEPHEARNVWREIMEGLRFVLNNVTLRALAGQAAMFNFFGNFIGTLYVLFTVDELGLSPVIVGWLIGIGGVGAVLGALVAAPVAKRYGIGPTLGGTLLFSSIVGLTMPFVGGPTWLVVAVLMANQLIGDIAISIYLITEVSLRQTLVPERMLGRANASMSFLTGALGPLAALLAGVVASVIGIRATLLIAILGIMASTLWIYLSPVRRLREPLSYPSPDV